jgi:alpha-tubulin suppressor-like RCC1 family protein
MGDALSFVDLGSDEAGGEARAVEVGAGGNHSCALMESGRVKCWGGNLVGALGLGEPTRDLADPNSSVPDTHRGDEPSEMGDALPFVALPRGKRAVGLAVATQHTCALLDDGSVVCWGGGADGQLGSGSLDTIGDRASQMGDGLDPVSLD